MKRSILVVDDDHNIVASFKHLFKGIYTVFEAYNGREAFEILASEIVDVIILDYHLPSEDGLEILKKIKKSAPDSVVIMISGYGDYQTIIQSTSLGAFDYIEKPLDIDNVINVVNKGMESQKVRSNHQLIEDESPAAIKVENIVGKSLLMKQIFKEIGRLVNNDVTVLVTGESGTGKELIARALHFNSPRKTSPFIPVNCSGINENILDNELFGHEPQAFTDAKTRIKGKFEAAEHGTVFLDEIGDMPLTTQSKLLRVLQEKEFSRLGSTKMIPLHARVIAATNRNIEELIESGKFRRDLYYRINVSRIQVPPLRERIEDLPLLVDYFISRSSQKLKKRITKITPSAMEELRQNDWYGNVRELENIIMSICIHKQDPVIDLSDIYSRYLKKDSSIDYFNEFIDCFLIEYGDEDNLLRLLNEKTENLLIKKLAERYRENKTLVSKKLGISRFTLRKKMDDGNSFVS